MTNFLDKFRNSISQQRGFLFTTFRESREKLVVVGRSRLRNVNESIEYLSSPPFVDFFCPALFFLDRDNRPNRRGFVPSAAARMSVDMHVRGTEKLGGRDRCIMEGPGTAANGRVLLYR